MKLTFKRIENNINSYENSYGGEKGYKSKFLNKKSLYANLCEHDCECLSVCLSVGLYVCRSVCLSVYLSVCLYVYRSVCQSVGRSVCLSVGRSVGRSVWYWKLLGCVMWILYATQKFYYCPSWCEFRFLMYLFFWNAGSSSFTILTCTINVWWGRYLVFVSDISSYCPWMRLIYEFIDLRKSWCCFRYLDKLQSILS